MPDPVIIDDGGSTRIKRVVPNGKGKMDELMDVDDSGTTDHVNIPASNAGSEILISEQFTQIMIVCQDSRGVPFSKSFTGWTNIEISSALNQTVKASKVAAGTKLLLMAYSTTDPIIEGKSHKRKRRYVVANSGPILQILIDGTSVYSAQFGFVPAIGIPALQMIYTSVAIT